MNGDFLKSIRETFGLKEDDPAEVSPLILAYIGDAIFDVVIRSILVNEGNTAVNKLHKKASDIVKAGTQAAFVKALMDDLTEEEKDIYRRGRNSKPHTKAKNATTMDYLDATGFEAVVGFLYLTDNMDRICELVKLGIERLELDILK